MSVTLIENFRAVFYSPFYAAIALGAYEAEGLDVRLQMSAAADQTLNTILAGSGQVSWGGPMRLMHALDESPGSGLVAFCEVVGRDPFYLIGRTPNPTFRMADLESKVVATVTEVPTPWYCLQHDLRLAGIEPSSIRRSSMGSMAENAAALRAGRVDVVQVFEPYACNLINEGVGHIWYAAASRGPTTYTTLNTTRDFLARNPDTVLRMTRAIYRTQRWIAAHDGRDLAAVIANYLPDIPVSTLAACCESYKSRGIWNKSPVQQRAGLEWLRDAMLACKAISKKFAFEDLADMRFAEQVMKENPPPI